jgi:WD40 repeat protein
MALPLRPPIRHLRIACEADAVIRSYFPIPALLTDYAYHDDVCFSSDGECFAVTSNSTVISIFKTDGCQFQRTIQNKKYGSTKSIFHPKESHRLYLNSGPESDHSARLLDIQSGSFSRYFVGHSSPITSLAAFGSSLITSSTDKTVRVWDEAQKNPTTTMQTRVPSNIALHPNGRCLAVVSPLSIALHDMRNLSAPVLTERIDAGTELMPRFGMRGKGLLVGGRGYAAEYCLTDLSTIATIPDVQEDRAPVVYTQDESFFCVPTRDGTIVACDSRNGDAVTVLAGHESAVNGIAFSSSFHSFVSAGQGSCLFWTVDRGTYYALWPS